MNSVSFHAAMAVAGAFVFAAAYILFGDALHYSIPPKRKKRRKGIVPGLANIGNSCFLNCILQALASCPSFREWLEHQEVDLFTSSLVSSLRKKMIVLCNEVEDSDLDAHDILRALRGHGWVISSEEQDAHELFHALTSTIDDELAMIRQQSNSLLNVSWLVDEALPAKAHQEASDTAQEVESTTKPDTKLPVEAFCNKDQIEETKMFPGLYRAPSIIAKVPFSLKQKLLTANGSLLSESPFKGHLASQLQCTVCGIESAEQWSSFESISLSLPGIATLNVSSSYSLQELLGGFIRPEFVSEVTCDGCTKVKGSKCLTTFAKQMTVGKLPDCLCIHIQRTVWLGNGYAFKRRDHILIPEVLNMDPYTYAVSLDCQSSKGRLFGGRQTKNLEEETLSACSQRAENLTLPLLHSLSTFCSTNSRNSNTPFSQVGRQTALYKLQAVVVHVGDVLTGHFITYRRGSKETCSTDRWFYTSDLVVREVSLEEVLDSNAYMILYERSLL